MPNDTPSPLALAREELARLRAKVAELEGDKSESEDRERRLNVMLSRTRAERAAMELAVTQQLDLAIALGEPYAYRTASAAGGVMLSRRGDLLDLKRHLGMAIAAARQAGKEEGT